MVTAPVNVDTVEPATATLVTIHALAGVDPDTVTVWLSVPSVFVATRDALLYVELAPVVNALPKVAQVPPGDDMAVIVLCTLVDA
jgi:hypothetical protein